MASINDLETDPVNPMGTDGFEFVEYTAPDPEALGRLFESMGFVRVARHRIASSALAFVLGFSSIFVLLGATASVLGRMVASHLGVLSIVAGIVIIAMGLHFLGVFKIALMHRQARLELRLDQIASRTVPASVVT